MQSVLLQSVVVRSKNEWRLGPSAVPRLETGEVAIRVAAVGLCRTDLYVLDGTLDANWPIVPGHEFSGVIESVSSEISDLHPGQRVAVNPVLPCGTCRYCRAANPRDCQQTRFLGVDQDGALQSLAHVPAANVFPIPDHLSFEAAAFAEPVAASLAVTHSGIVPSDIGLIAGENRIASLTQRVLAACGFGETIVCEIDALSELDEGQFDYVIETHATTEVLAALVRVIRPRGRVVLKSRQFRPIELCMKNILPKEPLFQAANYGPFSDAVSLLADGRVDVSDLIGRRYAIEQLADAVAYAQQHEGRKTMVLPNGAA
jgi:L-iditol 2-dehydrogenase